MATVKNKKIVDSKITTVKLTEETKNRLEKLKEHKKESFDDILKKILYVLNTVREEPEKAKKILEKIGEVRSRMIQEEMKQKEDLKREKENNKE